jgi:Flp pilus assembly protein TadG
MRSPVFADHAARFKRDDRGTIAMIFGFSILLLCGIIGLAVDASRAYSIAARAQSILDSASLAAAKVLDVAGATDQDVIDKANAFFAAHLAQHKDLGATFGTPLIVPHRGSQTVNVSVDVIVPTYFAGIVGKPQLTFTRESIVIYRTKGIELAMVLDTTGSMDWPTTSGARKIDVMIQAAQNVVTNLLTTSPGVLNTNRIALAPFSASVNVGAYQPHVGNGAGGDSCVVERAGGASTTDVAITGLTRAQAHPAGVGVCPLGVIQPLTTDAVLLNAQIADYKPDGGTAGHIGMAWGWNLISPNFGTIFTGPNTPAAYTDTTVIKAIIIMTDGEFNVQYNGVDPNVTFASLCTNMKLKGVKVYTIGFGLGMMTAPKLAMARGVLSGCVANPADYYEAESDAQLVGAFNNIADQLQTLRVAG